MSLRRTSSGLQSIHLFFKVDIVAFCEGGNALAKADVLMGQGEEGTPDALFWKAALKPLEARGKTVHTKSIGSKAVLESIADDVRTQNSSTILVCLDLDFDDFLSKKVDHQSVFYTYGYSWENDVVQVGILQSLFFDLVGDTDHSRQAWEELKDTLEQFSNQIMHYTEAEIELHRRRVGSLFDRMKPLSCVVLSKNQKPAFNALVARQSLSKLGLKRLPKRKMRLLPGWGGTCSYGKLVARYCFHLVIFFVRKINRNITITYEAFVRLAISLFRQRVHNMDDIVANYFIQQCDRVR